MCIFKGCEFVSPFQQHLQTLKLSVLFLFIFWRFLLKCLFIYHLRSFIIAFYLFASVDLIYKTYLKNEFFLHFSSTYTHQNLQFYSALYSEGFYWGVCSYFIHTDLYNSLFLKTWQKCIYLKAVSLFFHFSNTYTHQNLNFYSSLYSEVFYWGVCSYFIHLVLFLSFICVCRFLIAILIFKTFFSTTATLKFTKLYSFIPLYILKVFTEGFVHISFNCFFLYFIYLRL